MKDLKDIILEKLVINKNTKFDKYHYHPKDHDELQDLVNKLIKERGNKADLNDIDTSKIDSMAGIFLNSNFNGDISEWDVSNVRNMLLMFCDSKFDGDLSKWDVHNVTNMCSMFKKSQFTGKNGNISNWDVSKVKSMISMFKQSPLENNPPKWYKKK
jgi:surface protein